MEPLPEKAYRYYRERTGPLGALTCASSVDDEAAASDDAFGHVPPAEGWAAIAMPCGTGKTTLTRRYASEESLPVRLLDVDAILAKHDDYPRFSDWMEARIDSNRVNWAQLNSWRDRLLRDRLEHERVAGKLNVVLVHGRSTATACRLSMLGSIALHEQPYEQDVLVRRRRRFSDRQCEVMQANRELVVAHDPAVVLCDNHRAVESALVELLRAGVAKMLPQHADGGTTERQDAKARLSRPHMAVPCC